MDNLIENSIENIKLWEKNIPLYNKEFQNEYNQDAPTITPYIIKDGKKHSAFVICPGGGYNHRAKHEGGKIAEWLNSLGISAVVVNYRVFPYTHPTEIIDAKRSVRYVRYNSKEWNIDENKIGIIGFSAGAHLSGCVAEHFDKFESQITDEIDRVSAKPNLLALCYPVVTLSEDYGHKGSRENLLNAEFNDVDDKDLSIELSLEKNVRADMPPTFIWHTFEDKSVPVINSLEMAKALKEKEIVFELHIFPEGRHGLGLAEDIAGAGQWVNLFIDWLKRSDFIE